MADQNDEQNKGAKDAKSAEQSTRPSPPPPVRKQHAMRIGSGSLKYESTAGTMKLETDDGKHKADVFYVAYTLNGNEEKRVQRPITFAFNGGPGSSSVWLHLGSLGPRAVVMDDDGNPLSAPHQLRDNVHTWLKWTDLVFIDPVGTGYSRTAADGKREEFHGVIEDAESVAEFIRRWTAENARWLSPKYLAGESYGTTRAAALADLLQQKHGMAISGVLLISAVLSFQTIAFRHSTVNDLPYISFLPALAATSWYHKKLSARYQKNFDLLIREAREFAGKEYLFALMTGHRLSTAERQAVADRVAELTGLSAEYVLSCNLRVDAMRYMKELRRSERLVVGRLDSRFTGHDSDAAGEMPDADPSYSNITGIYTAGIYDYLRRELGYETPMTYEVLTPKVHPWKWGDADQGYLNVASNLASAMRSNAHMKVFVANGFFDLATPFFATELTLDHMEVETSVLRERVTMKYYMAGHMMYIHQASLKQFTRDVEAFYKNNH